MADLIAHSPMIQERGCEPYRIVIRDLGDEYVVHTQIIPTDGRKPFFHQGHYFQKAIAWSTFGQVDSEALCKAWVAFDRYARLKLGVREMEIASVRTPHEPGEDDPDIHGY